MLQLLRIGTSACNRAKLLLFMAQWSSPRLRQTAMSAQREILSPSSAYQHASLLSTYHFKEQPATNFPLTV